MLKVQCHLMDKKMIEQVELFEPLDSKEESGPWEKHTLGSFLTPISRSVSKPDKEYLGLGIRSHGKGTFLKPNSDPKKISMKTLYQVKENDLIVNITFAWEGAVAIVEPEDHGALVSHRFPTYKFETDLVIPEFFKYVITQDRFKYLLRIISPGGAGRNRVLNKTDFLKLEVEIPPLSEQKKIARILGTWDRAINLTERLIEAKEKRFKWLLKTLISDQQDNLEWREVKIIDFSPLQRGFDLPAAQIKEGTYPVVYSNGIKNYHSEYKAKAPGVVTGRSGTIGAVTYVTQDYWPHNTSLWVTDFKGNHPKFVFYFLQNLRLDRFYAGSGVPTLNRNDVHKKSILIPTLPEQKAIANTLDTAEKEVEFLKQLTEKYRTQKHGLMQQLLTGKVRVKI